jgi:serine/threonine protein kinase
VGFLLTYRKRRGPRPANRQLMNFQIGERLHGAGPASQPGGYVVTALVRETPWYDLYAGKKILYNFDFTSKRIRETEDNEWLNVFLRTLRYPRLDDSQDVARRRALARAEVRILGNRGSNLWPEPIDLLEIDNTRDAFTFPPDPHDREPIVVFARPHGQPVGDWQQGVVPVSSLLSILAELLEFVRQAHAEGLLLQGLGPAAILIDRADRVHYIGSEMVVEQQEAGQRVPQQFPAERYPRGFAAPELFDHGRAPGARSDLYAWGTLAYFLLTGQTPWQIALEQGRPWAQLQEAHFVKLEEALRTIPPAHVHVWAEELGLSGAALVAGWPENVVAMFRWLLHPEPARRPRSADEVRAWLVALPPAQVRAALALDAGGGTARLYLDAAAFEPGAEIEVRRALGQAPAQPGLGELVYEGPLRPVVVDERAPLTDSPYFYTVFARRRHAGGAVYSGGVEAQALEPTARDLLPLAEAEAAQADGDQLPPRIALCFSAMDAVGLAEILLEARAPRARAWGVRRLGEVLARGPSPQAQELLQRSLADPAPELRLEAAGALWHSAPEKSDALLLRITNGMGRGQLDDAIQAAQALTAHGVPAEQVQRTIAQLEGERPSNCPICHVQLAHRERKQHLHMAHGFIEVGPSMLPRKQAFSRLWDRVFREGDQQSHQQLLELYGHEAASNGTNYAEALEAEIVRRADLDDSGSQGQTAWKRWEPWLACVRGALPGQPVLRHLLLAEADRVREVGRALVLPGLGEKLRGDRADAAQLRRLIEEVFPGHELLEQRIRLCAQLPQVGVDQVKASACQALFQQELPIACPECPARVPAKDLEIHLRRAHGIFEFRGVRRGYNETRDALLEAVCGPRPDVPAWQALEGLAQDRHAEQARQRLVVWVGHTLKRLDKEPRARAIAAVGEAIARAGSGLYLLPHLLGEDVDASWKNVARQLALAIVAHLDTPLSAEMLQRIKPYLAAKLLPQEARQSATAGLLRVFGGDSPIAQDVLTTYVSATNKVRAVERLQALEAVVGQAPAIEKLVTALEDRIRMTCPRCNEQLERCDMVKHLWDRHHLLLEGRRVREPWRVLADWVVDYRLEKDPALLERCRALAEQADPEEGKHRLQRLLLRQGIEDREAWNALLARARQRKTSVCPHCYAQVAAPASTPAAPLTALGRRLEGAGYALELREAGLSPRLTIEGPGSVLYDAGAPDGLLTRNGALSLIVLPAMALFGFLLHLLTPLPLPLIAALALGLGFVLAGLTLLVFPTHGVRGRLVDLAWTALVPSLLEQLPNEESGRFLASLAETSRTQGSRSARREVVEEVLETVKGAPQGAVQPWPALAAVWRLQIADLEASAQDPMPAFVDLVEHVFTGEAPARCLGPVLDEIKEGWPRGRLARVQAILMARAAELGLEIADLANLVRVQPALAPLLGAGDLDHLAQLRLFWRMRASWPRWLERADNIFDLARAGGERTLSERPDLLLLVHKAPIYVGTRGVWLKEVCIAELPAKVDVAALRHAGGEGFEIVLGKQRVWFSANPNEIADELEDWLRFYFRDFLPQVAAEQARPSGAAGAKLRRANAIACPECRQLVLPIVGEVGLAADGEGKG